MTLIEHHRFASGALPGTLQILVREVTWHESRPGSFGTTDEPRPGFLEKVAPSETRTDRR